MIYLLILIYLSRVEKIYLYYIKGGITIKEQNGTILSKLLFMLFKLVAMIIFGIVVSLMGDVIYDKTINVSNEDG